MLDIIVGIKQRTKKRPTYIITEKKILSQVLLGELKKV